MAEIQRLLDEKKKADPNYKNNPEDSDEHDVFLHPN